MFDINKEAFTSSVFAKSQVREWSSQSMTNGLILIKNIPRKAKACLEFGEIYFGSLMRSNNGKFSGLVDKNWLEKILLLKEYLHKVRLLL